MRFGFTTGSCAAAAAKAATYMLLSGRKKTSIVIETPKGIPFDAEIIEISTSQNCVSCAVVKDGGDDPDVTTGAYVFAQVSYLEDGDQGQIVIDGGSGVGRVTKPGLDQPVGSAAINSVPRAMITKEVTEVCKLLDYQGALQVVISVRDGQTLANRTFNPRLGIVGGISILGTSGVVEPMSAQALIDSIHVELNQQKALGKKYISIAPGNYGLDFMKQTFDFDLDQSVKCSNFVGKTMDLVKELAFEKVLFVGHIGKLIKVAGGIMNTHSHEADSRMEILAANAALEGLPLAVLQEILEAVTTEEGIRILKEYDNKANDAVMERILNKILYYLNKRLETEESQIQLEVILFSNEFGMLAKSAGAEALVEEIRSQNE